MFGTRQIVLAIVVAGALTLGAGTTSCAGGVTAPLDGIFGSNALRSDNLKLFPKWRDMLARYFADSQVADDCAPGVFSRCALDDWQAFLDDQQQRDPMAQLDAVNRYMNKHPYIIDPRNWGVEDYWATPLQFFDRDGDCEDYAIAKLMSLRALGWDSDHMRIVVLNDTNLRVQHAVLAVAVQGAAYVLDNQTPVVMAAERIRHYRPVYSINEQAWWLHRS